MPHFLLRLVYIAVFFLQPIPETDLAAWAQTEVVMAVAKLIVYLPADYILLFAKMLRKCSYIALDMHPIRFI